MTLKYFVNSTSVMEKFVTLLSLFPIISGCYLANHSIGYKFEGEVWESFGSNQKFRLNTCMMIG